MKRLSIPLLILFLLCSIKLLNAQIPDQFSVQMLLADGDGNKVPDGKYDLTIKIYDALNGGTSIYSETQSVEVTHGLANVNVGVITSLTDIEFSKACYVGVSINNDPELYPRLRLLPSTYSLAAKAVYGSTNVVPSDGNVGIGTLTPIATLDVNGNLRIAQVDELSTSPEKILVQDDDKTVKQVSLESLIKNIEKSEDISFDNGISIPLEKGGFMELNEEGLIIKDSGGEAICGFDYDGYSMFSSVSIKEELLVELANGFFEIDEDGLYLIDSNDESLMEIEEHGWYFKEMGVVDKGLIIGGNNENNYLVIDSTGNMVLRNSTGEIIKDYSNIGGSTTHEELETFLAGLKVGANDEISILEDGIAIPRQDGGKLWISNEVVAFFDSEDVALSGFDKDGALFNLIKIPTDGGGYIEIDEYGIIVLNELDEEIGGIERDGSAGFQELDIVNSMRIGNSSGNSYFDFDYGFFNLYNSEGENVFYISPNGLVSFKGRGYFEDDIYIQSSDGGHIVLNDLGIGIYNSNFDEVLSLGKDGIITCNRLIANEKNFRIDHPLNPSKYLLHSSVESSERTNIYNGNVILDSNGEASVQLPDWFDALNENFTYQLTAIGGPGAGLYVATKLENNAFSIAGGSAGLEVSWQITGTRKDEYALQNPFEVEVDKAAYENKTTNP